MSFSLTPERLHELYFGTERDVNQRALYDAYPTMKGYSDASSDRERFRAVLILTIYQAIVPGSAETKESFLLVSRPKEKWVLEQIQAMAKEVFGRLKGSEKAKETAIFIGRCFKAIRMGHLVLQLAGEPARWSSFGFTREDPVPEWLRAKLLVFPDPAP